MRDLVANGLALQLSRIQPNVCALPFDAIYPQYVLLRTNYSCKDKNTAQSTTSGWEEAWVAALWQGLVCRMYDTDYWELVEGGDTYVGHIRASSEAVADEGYRRIRGIRYLQDTSTR